MTFDTIEQNKNTDWFRERTIDLFPNVLYFAKPERYFQVSEEVKTALEDVNWRTKPDWGKTHLMSDPTFKENFIEKNNLKIFKQEIDHHVGLYAKKHHVVLKKFTKNYDILDSWASKFEYGDYGHIQNYGYADITGIYYYKRPTANNKTGNIFFNPSGSGFTSNTLYRKLVRSAFYFPEGTLLLFPGFLSHGFASNEVDRETITVTFNIKLRT